MTNMQHRTLGPRGPSVSLAGLGCSNFGWRMPEEASRPIVHKALDLGITFFDTADSYGSDGSAETCLGAILGPRRKDILLATKYGNRIATAADRTAGTGGARGMKRPGTSRAYTMTAVEASLKRLRTDWIDLYQIHYHDADTPSDETIGALEDLVQAGKIRFYGCSTHSAAQIDQAMDAARRRGVGGFVSSQNPYNLLERQIEDDVIPAAERHGLGLITNVPLAMGMLTGKYRRGATPSDGVRLGPAGEYGKRYLTEALWPKVERLSEFATGRGKELIDVALGWLAARRPVASIIAGAAAPAQVERNVRAINGALASDELAELDRLSR